MPVSVQPARELDSRSLLALAHPLRIRLLDSLTRGGPATASQLAYTLGESSGATSYHLRILARHGFVVDEPDLGSKLERFWSAAAGGIHLRGFEFLNDETTRAATRVLVGEVHRQATDHLERWFDESVNWPREWQEASTDHVYAVELDPAQTSALRTELTAVMARYRKLPAGPSTRTVEVHINLFPTGDAR